MLGQEQGRENSSEVNSKIWTSGKCLHCMPIQKEARINIDLECDHQDVFHCEQPTQE